MKNKLGIFSIAIVLSSSALALDSRLKSLDLNGDGYFAAWELKEVMIGREEAFITKADKDKDGKLSYAEMNKALAPSKKVKKGIPSEFKALDRNGDNEISRDEYDRAYKKSEIFVRPERFYRGYDKNGDNVVSLSEYKGQ